MRPKAVLAERVHIGNFVELKNTHVGVATKANHLSYLGDATIGAGGQRRGRHGDLQLRWRQ